MSSSIALSLMILCMAGRVTSQSVQPRIVGGTPVVANLFPWVALGSGDYNGEVGVTIGGALIYDYSSSVCVSDLQCSNGEPCVPDLITRQGHCQATWIATTASGLGGFGEYLGQDVPAFVFGSNNWTSPVATMGACTEIYTYPSFSYDKPGYYDMGLCKLANATTVTRTLIWNSGQDSTYTNGAVAVFAGWGATNDTDDNVPQTILRGVNIHTSTNSDCQIDFLAQSSLTNNYVLLPSQLCAGGILFGDITKGSCTGDTGSPLFVLYQNAAFLLGLDSVSFNNCSSTAPVPDIYTRAAVFKTWIAAQQVCSRQYAELGTCTSECFIPTRDGNITCPKRVPTTRSPTQPPSTRSPTQPPSTRSPTPPPSTRSPTAKPTTRSPTAKPTTRSPTPRPTTRSPTPRPTTRTPSIKPTRSPTFPPSTRSPTQKPTTKTPTAKPTTKAPTPKPTTKAPTSKPTTKAPTVPG